MGMVKGFAGPLSAINHDGVHYPVGTPVELPEEEAARLGADAFTPASDREMADRLKLEGQRTVDRVQSDVARAQAEYDAVAAKKKAADEQHERETRHLQLQLTQKERVLKDLQKRLSDAQAAIKGTSEPEGVETALAGGTHVENTSLAAPLAEKLKAAGYATVASVRKASDDDLKKAKLNAAEVGQVRKAIPAEEGGKG